MPIHLASDFYDVDGWLTQAQGPSADELDALGDVNGDGTAAGAGPAAGARTTTGLCAFAPIRADVHPSPANDSNTIM